MKPCIAKTIFLLIIVILSGAAIHKFTCHSSTHVQGEKQSENSRFEKQVRSIGNVLSNHNG